MSSNPNIPLKIGVFDSGIGGLTVLQSLLIKAPQNNYIYLGDTARVPYGSKSPKTIKKYLDQCISFLISHKVDAIVVACNSASSVLETCREYPIPIFGVIEPSAELAVKNALHERIAIIATKATIKQKTYIKAIHQLNPSVSVYQQACPLLVPIIEEGLLDDPLTNLVLFRYLNPLMQTQPDALILGCTHYPLLQTAIQKIIGPDIQIISSASSVADRLCQHFSLKEEESQELQVSDVFITDETPIFGSIYKNLFKDFKLPEPTIVNIF